MDVHGRSRAVHAQHTALLPLQAYFGDPNAPGQVRILPGYTPPAPPPGPVRPPPPPTPPYIAPAPVPNPPEPITGLPTNTMCNIIDNSGTGWFCRTDSSACYTYCLPGSGLKVQEQFMFYRTALSSTTPISVGTSMVIKSSQTNRFCRVSAAPARRAAAAALQPAARALLPTALHAAPR